MKQFTDLIMACRSLCRRRADRSDRKAGVRGRHQEELRGLTQNNMRTPKQFRSIVDTSCTSSSRSTFARAEARWRCWDEELQLLQEKLLRTLRYHVWKLPGGEHGPSCALQSAWSWPMGSRPIEKSKLIRGKASLLNSLSYGPLFKTRVRKPK